MSAQPTLERYPERRRTLEQRLLADVARTVAKVQQRDAEHWRAELEAAGFTTTYAEAEAAWSRRNPDRTTTPAHALLAAVLEGA